MTYLSFPTSVLFGSFPMPEVHSLTQAEVDEAVEGLQALVDSIPPARTVEQRADDIRTTSMVWRLESLIDALDSAIDYRSDDADQQADAHMLAELRAVRASTDRFIGRLAKREADEVAKAWALQGVAGIERVSA